MKIRYGFLSSTKSGLSSLILFTCFCGLITYGFALTHNTYDFDSTHQNSMWSGAQSGRWVNSLFRQKIIGPFIPYLSLLIGIFFSSIGIALISRTLRFGTLLSYVFTALCVSYPQLAYQFCFPHQAESIGFGIMTGALSSYLFILYEDKHPLGKLALSLVIILLMTFTLASYQSLAFIPFIVFIAHLYTKIDQNDFLVVPELKKLFWFFTLGIASSILYIFTIWFLDPNFVSSDSSNTGHLLKYYLGGGFHLCSAANVFGEHIMGISYYGNRPFLIASLLGLLGVVFGYRRHVIPLKVLTLLSLFLLSFFFLFVLSSYHLPTRIFVCTNILFAFLITYFLSKVQLIIKDRNFSRIVVSVCIFIFFWNTFYTTKLFSLRYDFQKKDINTAILIDFDIRKTIPDFDEDKNPVYLQGIQSKYKSERLHKNTETFGLSVFSSQNVDIGFLKNFLVFNKIANYDIYGNKTDMIKEYPNEFDSIRRMPIWPTKGSIRKIGGVTFIKLGYKTRIAPEPMQIIGLPVIPNFDVPEEIDSFEHAINIQNIPKGNGFVLEGWCHKKGVSDDCRISLLLNRNSKKGFLLKAINEKKLDFQKFGKKNNAENGNDIYFYTEISYHQLPRGLYKVGILIEEADSEKQYFFG